MNLILLIIILSYTFTTTTVIGYRILGFFPHGGQSHFYVFKPLLLELAKKGHQMVVVSKFPQKQSIPNYIDIDLSKYGYINNPASFETIKRPLNIIEDMYELYVLLNQIENMLKSKEFQNFIKMDHKFDLLITESFNTRLSLSIGHKFKIPVVLLSSHVLMPFTTYDSGNPLNPSYIPVLFGKFNDKMNFWQRLENTFLVCFSSFVFEYYLDNKSEELVHKYIDSSVPPLKEIAKNSSLVLVNSHFSLHRPRPLAPNVVEIGGLSINRPNPLPKDIEKFINESKDGVIYFCMGSLLQGSSFPEDKKEAFLYAFSKVPQRVLWKWEGDEFPEKSDNIMTSKWMPQRDILAHPNVKLFISHGGLLGTSEAVYEGVPVLGIPIFGDQKTNVRALEAAGAGILLEYEDISKEMVLKGIQKIINNPSYKENAIELSRRYRDRPMSPLDTAVYWTEYVMRHKGAPHLKSAAVDMPWYQYLLFDVVAFMLAVLIVVVLIIYYIFKVFIKLLLKIIVRNNSKIKCN